MHAVNHPLRLSGRPRARSGSGLGSWAEPAAFLIPAFVWVKFTLVGRIFLPELILIALLPFLLAKRGRLLTAPLPRTFLILAALWLMAQMLTDVIRGSDFHDYSRGWAKLVFTMLSFCALYLLLYGSRRRLVLFAAGVAAGEYLSYMLNPSVYADQHPWKFGLSLPTTLAVVLLAQWRPIFRVPVLPSLLILLVGLYSMAVGSRSYAGVTILVALYVLAHQIAGRRGGPTGSAPLARSAMFLVMAVMAAAVMLELYEYMAVQGYLTERARQVYDWQSTGGSFSILLGGRAEIVASIRAVMDSPIIGHGSWAKDPEYASYILDLRQLGYNLHLSRLSGGDLIPTHSHLMGAWVESGIMGALFWLWVLVLIVRVLAHQYLVRDTLGPLVAFVGFLTVWDIFFSPFGAHHRYLISFKIVLMMYAWDVLYARIYLAPSGRARLMSSYRIARGPTGSPGPALRGGRGLTAETAPHPRASQWRPPG